MDKIYKAIQEAKKKDLILAKRYKLDNDIFISKKQIKKRKQKQLKKIRKARKKLDIKLNFKRDYKKYLLSDAWKEKRLECLLLKGNNCQRCNRGKLLHIHHATYDRFKNENIETDLFVLCQKCHTDFHKKYQSTSILNTREFLMI